MNRFLLVCAAALAGLVGSAGAQTINGVNVNPRVFNDYPDSNLTIDNHYPTSVHIRDVFPTTPTGKFANRHDLLLSSDGGTTAAAFNNNESFDISADITLTDGSDSPKRKEAGIRVNSSVGGDGLFIINSDAGEIVAFGGPFPFYRFNNTTFSYTPGQTITMGVAYNAAAHTIDYRVSKGGQSFNSGPLPFTNNENGIIDGSTAGFYGQFSPSAPGDFGDVNFANIAATLTTVPEPVGIAAFGALAVGLLGRRRYARAAL
jgi:hypothetical protein